MWEVNKLKKRDPVLFDNLQFMSTHRVEDDRRKMHAHQNGFFRYNPNQAPKETPDGDSDSISHMLAIAAIAQLSSINFVCGREKFALTPTSVDTERRIQLISEGKYSYYIPDIVFTFAEDSYWAKRWGDKLAVEVKHTHPCNSIKICDFENHGIPIIEVNIENVTIEKKINTKSPNMQQMKEYFAYLVKIFETQVYGKILSNPVSVAFNNECIISKTHELNLKEKALQALTAKYEEFEKTSQKNQQKYNADIKDNQKEINDLNQMLEANSADALALKNDLLTEFETTRQKLQQTECELNGERSKGWFDKLLGR